MFTVNDDLSIYVTRGDMVFLKVTAENKGEPYTFNPGDVVRFKVFRKKDCKEVVLQKDFPVAVATQEVEIVLEERETKIGEVISKPVDYWYEVELNPDREAQTIIGYDEDGARVFKLFPEGRHLTEDDPIIQPEDIPVVDESLDLTSKRPVENRAVARKIIHLQAAFDSTKADITAKSEATAKVANENKARLDNLIAHDDINSVSQSLEYLDFITEATRAKIDGVITSDGAYATVKVNLREANLIYGGTTMAVFVIPDECRPIDTGLIHTEDGLEYRIDYDTENKHYTLSLTAKSDVTVAPSGAGSVTMTYALGDYELKDIRVGVDNLLYSTAGDAVRGQIRHLKYGQSDVFKYTLSANRTEPFYTTIRKNTRYKVVVTFGDNVTNIDIGYTTANGNDVLLVDNAVSGQEYEFTVESDGSRFRFWTYLANTVETDVNVELKLLGVDDRCSAAEARLTEVEAALHGYKARVTKDNLSVATGFILSSFYKIKASKKFYVSFDTFDYDVVDRLNIYCSDLDGNEIFHDALVPEIGELYECCTDKADSTLNIYLYPKNGGAVDITMSIYEDDGTRKRIVFNEKDIAALEAVDLIHEEAITRLYEEVGVPWYIDHIVDTSNVLAYDLEFSFDDNAQYIFKAESYTGQTLNNIELYAFNSMQDYKVIKKAVNIGDTVVFNGDSAYRYFRVYLVRDETREPSTLSFKLADYNGESLLNRVSELETVVYETKTKPDVLILGDSYSQMGHWINQLKNIVGLGEVVNLGVSSATLKDRYADRVNYPYNDRPVTNDQRGGNVNTFGSQVEKLKRLMLGEDLDVGEVKLYENNTPDIILIEGGTNDAVDASTDGYISQIYTVENAYIARRSDNASHLGYIKVPTHYENTDRTTFGGAMRYLYGVLHNMFPSAFIFFVTPCGLHYMSGGDHPYLEKGEQIKYAASLLGIPVIDWGVNGRLSVCDNVISGTGTENDPYIYDAAGEYSFDALHPNAEGARFLAMEAAKVLVGYNLVEYKE